MPARQSDHSDYAPRTGGATLNFSDPAIQAASIARVYRNGAAPVAALRDASLTVDSGDFVAVMGPSGSGKSTLLHLIGLLDSPDSGALRLYGVDTAGLSDSARAGLRNRLIGFIFQQFNLLSRASALENVVLPCLYSGHRPDARRARALLADVGLADRVHHRPTQLSGGEQQRVAIARALMLNPRMILADEPTGNLDSTAAAEIMKRLSDLNRRGITIMLVTHDPSVACYARRQIRMLDGWVVEDTGRSEGFSPSRSSPDPDAESAGTRFSAREGWAFVREAMRSVRAAKVRSALSMLGILIGTFGVIAMLSLVADARRSIQAQIRSFGTNVLVLNAAPNRQAAGLPEGTSLVRLNREDARAIEQSLPRVRIASATVTGRVQLQTGRRRWKTQMFGTETRYVAMTANEPAAGRFFTEEEVSRRARVVLLGRTPCRELFGDENPIGQALRINRQTYRVIGILPEKGVNPWRDQDDMVILPITTAMQAVSAREDVDAILMEVRDAAEMTATQAEIHAFMLRRKHLDDAQGNALTFRNLAKVGAAFTAVSSVLSWLFAGIAAMSLLVGGVGIMNIMLASVTERTREIGLRKAVGASRSDIEMQFLIEAVSLGLCGGIAGVALGYGAAAASTALGWPVTVTPFIASVALAFSALTGVLSGVWPARRAAAFHPIDALRYE